MTRCRREVLLAGAAASVLPGAARPGAASGPQPGDILVADQGGAKLHPAAIASGAGPILAWPMDRVTGIVRSGARFNQILALRTRDGILRAFSAICPHAACLVSDWDPDRHLLKCPCHGSEYDPAQGGRVVAGPAPQPLPMLPVRESDGVVAVAGPFSATPGGHASRTM